MHRFYHDRRYLARIRQKHADPFELRSFDFAVNTVVDVHKARALSDLIVASVDSLAVRFIPDDGALTVTPESGQNASVCEISPYEMTGHPHAKDRIIQQCRTIDLIHGDSFRIFYSTIPLERRSIVRIVCSHFSVDHVTISMIRRVIADLSGNTRSWHAQRASYFEWMDMYYRYVQSDEAKRESDFWSDFGNGLNPRFPGCQELNRQTGPARVATVILSSFLTEQLKNFARDVHRLRVLDLVLAALILAIGDALDTDTPACTWTSSGRYPIFGRDFSRTPGYLSARHPIQVRLANSTLASAATALRSSIANLPHRGDSYPWIVRFNPEFHAESVKRLRMPIVINVREATTIRREVDHYLPIPLDEPRATFRSIDSWEAAAPIYVTVDLSTTVRLEIMAGAESRWLDIQQRMIDRIVVELGRSCKIR